MARLADIGIMEEMILNEAFKTIGDLEKAYLNLEEH